MDVWEDALNEAFVTELFKKDEIKADLVQASHHGSRYSSSRDLWLSILRKNALVAISASYQGNPYQHPHTETLDDLRDVALKHFPIRVACTNAPPICWEVHRLTQEETHAMRFITNDMHDARELLNVLPEHDVFVGPSVERPTCFGKMHLVVDPKGDPVVSFGDRKVEAATCHYIGASDAIVSKAKKRTKH